MSYSELPNDSYLNEISNGDEVFKQKLIEIIKCEFPSEKEAFKYSFSTKNYEKAAEDVHKLKHKINIFSLSKGYKIAVDFENELKQGTFKSYLDFNEVLDNVEEYLNSL